MQENAALRDAIAAAQEQLHEAAAAAASRVLAEKALKGEQQARQALEQAHSLVRAFIFMEGIINLPSVCAQCLTFCLCPMKCPPTAAADLPVHSLCAINCCPFHERSPA